MSTTATLGGGNASPGPKLGSFLNRASVDKNPKVKKVPVEYQRYMDKMSEALNKNMEKNIFPHWRNHQSMKGWSSMNYPSILKNPLIRRPNEEPARTEPAKFSNLDRPISAPGQKLLRPFTNRLQNMRLRGLSQQQSLNEQQPPSTTQVQQQLDQTLLSDVTQTAGSATEFPYLAHQQTQAQLQISEVKGSRSISSIAFQTGAAIASIDSVMQRYPLPPKKGAKKEEKKKDAAPVPVEPKILEPESVQQAYAKTVSWTNATSIANKFAVGTLTTAKYQERVQVFNQMNAKVAENSALFPQQSYFGPTPDPEKDPYNRRKVKQLNDISFEESGASGSDEEDLIFEETKSLKRLPQTILTEENLKVYLTHETERLNLEHAYWLKDAFLDKIGRMASNLREISLRRLRITNRAFTELVTHLKRLEIVDLSDCSGIGESGLKLMLVNNNKTLQQLQLSNIPQAITDIICDHMSELQNLNFLDISFAKQVSDDGLQFFKNKHLPIRKLFINGLVKASNVGLTDIVVACRSTLKILEAGFMDQETVTGAFCVPLAQAFELQELHLTGCSNIGDDGISALPKGEIRNEETRSNEVVGLQKLRILKLSGLSKISDHPLLKLAQTSRVLEHLEVCKCELLTEYSIENIIKTTPTLKYLDLNGIPAITPQALDLLKAIRGDLLIRRFLYQNVDPKDNGLRVPRRVADKKKKKKKKAGGKKKK